MKTLFRRQSSKLLIKSDYSDYCGRNTGNFGTEKNIKTTLFAGPTVTLQEQTLV